MTLFGQLRHPLFLAAGPENVILGESLLEVHHVSIFCLSGLLGIIHHDGYEWIYIIGQRNS